MSAVKEACVNPARGEATILLADGPRKVRPSFAALVAAEEETGSLLALAERASIGAIGLGEIEALLWHCLADRNDLARERVGEALLATGMTGAMPAVRTILRQILTGGE